mgnify:CR=1 FL=1
MLVQPNDPKNNIGPCRFIATSTKLGSGAYGACLLGRDAAKARKPKDVDQALQDTTAALRGSDFMHKFSGESDALLEAFLESGPAPIPQQDA